jgi:hypothetical protein
MSGFDLCYNKGMVSSEIARFFWDVDPASLEPKSHKAYIIERLLEFGDEKAVRWLFEEYTCDDTATVLESSRSLSLKSRNFLRLRLTGSAHVWPRSGPRDEWVEIKRKLRDLVGALPL